MDPESIPKTASSSHKNPYEFLRMPFGLKNVPPTFQRAMNIFFTKIPNVLVYMVDITIFSDTLEENPLKSVFQKLIMHNLKLQLDKTEIFKRELLYLGHDISENGTQPNPAKLVAIKNISYSPDAKSNKTIFRSLFLRFYGLL